VPSRSSLIEVLRGFPILEIGMVGDDYEWFFCPSEVWSPMCNAWTLVRL
jgi:hypothetical protein